MSTLNKVMLIGNVGKDPDARYIEPNNTGAASTMVVSFPLATTERFRDREATEWHNIVAWRNQAEFAKQYIRKGSQVFVEGRIRTRSYEQQGVKKYITEIIADNIQLLGRRGDNPAADGAEAPAPQQVQSAYSQPAPQPHAQPAVQPQSAYNQPAGFQPRAAAEPPQPIDIMGNDDLPF